MLFRLDVALEIEGLIGMLKPLLGLFAAIFVCSRCGARYDSLAPFARVVGRPVIARVDAQ